MKSPTAVLCITRAQKNDFLPPELFKQLEGLLPGLIQISIEKAWNAEPEFFENIRPEILITGWGTPRLPANLQEMKSVKYVCHLGGSTRGVVQESLLQQGLLVTNWGTLHAATVAECALLLLLSCLRRATKTCLNMHVHKGWIAPSDLRPASLFGRRVGIHGFGAVARQLIPLLRPFEVKISAFSQGVPKACIEEHGVIAGDSLEDLFASSDVLVEAEAASPANLGSVTEKHFRLLSDDAVFVNVGRAAVVNEQALLMAAEAGRIQFGLDVFHSEPLPPNSILRGLPNVCLLAHQAGPTPDKMSECGAFAIENIRAYLNGDALKGVVSPQDYQRGT